MAAVSAVFGVVTAYATRDTLLGAVTGLAKAVVALGVGYGLELTAEQTGALIAFVTVAVGFWQRTQTSPLEHGTFRDSGASLNTAPAPRAIP